MTIRHDRARNPKLRIRRAARRDAIRRKLAFLEA